MLGYHVKDEKPSKDPIPIIFQKNEKSDFSLDEFLTEAIEHTKKGSKIVQFNFFGIEAVIQSVNILLSKKKEV